MNDLQKQIIDWLKTLKGWQTELAYRLLTKSQMADSDVDDIISMLKQNTAYDGKDFPNIGMSVTGSPIILLSIDSVENIELLSPRNPLKFAENGITVIYGSNGTGKSGYTRILKKICGKPHSRNLIGNIYESMGNTGKCSISYKCNGEERTCEWEMNASAIDDLRAVDIFDTETGWSYLNEANTVSYIPPIIRFFTDFSKYHDVIKDRLSTEKESLKSQLPTPSLELSQTSFIQNIYQATNLDLSKFVWTGKNEETLLALDQKLKTDDLQKAAQEIREKKRKIDLLINEINEAAQKVTQQYKDEVVILAKNVAIKEQAVLDAGKALNDISKLEGIGTESWKQLWLAAKEYASHEAYKDNHKLYQHERCVLCNQILDDKAKERLRCFDSFITNELSQNAATAKKEYDDYISALPIAQTRDTFINKCIASGLDDNWGNQIFHIWTLICNNGEAIRNGNSIINISEEVKTALSALQKKSEQYKINATRYEAEAKLFDRDTTFKQFLELKSQKWATEQLESLKTEKKRQEQLVKYNSWISQTNTRGITSKANEVGDLVITRGFVDRFNAELQKLGADNIRVEFVKRSNKGTTLHALKIANETHDNPADILSEGEARIIALSAFLTDVTGGNNNPFVFDDPISSLDQTYEEKTIKRLVELSKTRQVIVFTHRISLLSQLNDASEKIATLGIRCESWGTGEIGDLPMSAKSPQKALKNLLNDKVTKAKKILEQEGADAYYPFGKMLCSDLRILIERIVETDLLSGVILRYRRAVNTMGKIGNLAKITTADCDMIDKFMTKYSYYEHSQPLEAPVELPKPDAIKQDIKELLSWIDEFDKRK